MTVDDAVVGRETVAAASILIIRPTTSGEEWTIHNIYIPHGIQFNLYRCDDPTGVDKGILWGPISHSLSGQFNFHCTNDEFLLIENISLTVGYDVGYDGLVTNVS